MQPLKFPAANLTPPIRAATDLTELSDQDGQGKFF